MRDKIQEVLKMVDERGHVIVVLYDKKGNKIVRVIEQHEYLYVFCGDFYVTEGLVSEIERSYSSIIGYSYPTYTYVLF